MTSEAQVETQPRHGSIARAGFIGLLLFSIAHFFVDLYSSGLGSFQPLLVERFGLSMTQAGMPCMMMVGGMPMMMTSSTSN